MDLKTFSEVGVAAAALYVIFKLGCTFLDGYFQEKNAERETKKDSMTGHCDPNIIEVIQNNTRVMDKLSDLMQKIITGQKQQDIKMDELLAHARQQNK